MREESSTEFGSCSRSLSAAKLSVAAAERAVRSFDRFEGAKKWRAVARSEGLEDTPGEEGTETTITNFSLVS